jgi:hypothetical protein
LRSMLVCALRRSEGCKPISKVVARGPADAGDESTTGGTTQARFEIYAFDAGSRMRLRENMAGSRRCFDTGSPMTPHLECAEYTYGFISLIQWLSVLFFSGARKWRWIFGWLVPNANCCERLSAFRLVAQRCKPGMNFEHCRSDIQRRTPRPPIR